MYIYIYFARSRLIYKQDRGLAEGRSCNKKTGSRFRQNDISRYAASVWFRYRHSSRCHQLILFYIPSWVGILSLSLSPLLLPLPPPSFFCYLYTDPSRDVAVPAAPASPTVASSGGSRKSQINPFVIPHRSFQPVRISTTRFYATSAPFENSLPRYHLLPSFSPLSLSPSLQPLYSIHTHPPSVSPFATFSLSVFPFPSNLW